MTMAQHDAVLRSTEDEVNITVCGNPVLDIIINVQAGARYAQYRNVIEKIAIIRENGDIEFMPNKYIGFYLQDVPLVWGPFTNCD